MVGAELLDSRGHPFHLFDAFAGWYGLCGAVSGKTNRGSSGSWLKIKGLRKNSKQKKGK